MKKTVCFRQGFIGVTLLTGLLALPGLAQQTTPAPAAPKDRSEVTIKIIDRTDDGQVRELERTYQLDEPTAEKREALVTRLVDSLKAGRRDGQRARMTITIDDTINQTGQVGSNRKPGSDILTPRPNIREFQFRLDGDAVRDQANRLRGQADKLRAQADRFRMEMPRDFDMKLMMPFENWAREANMKPASVRGLQVYPNNPDRNVLNIRFSAPAKGNVLILVTNAKGKEVARKEISDFSGDYVGQLDLNKRATGTLFVTVTQNEDGAVKRVVVE